MYYRRKILLHLINAFDFVPYSYERVSSKTYIDQLKTDIALPMKGMGIELKAI